MSIIFTDVWLSRRALAVLFIFHFAFLTWYFLFSRLVLSFIVGSAPEAFTRSYIVFNSIVVLAAVSGSFLVKTTDTIHIVYWWGFLTPIGTISIFLISTPIWRLALYYLLGGLFGISQLAFFSYFTSLTVLEGRGRTSGLIGLLTFAISAFLVTLAVSLDFLGLVTLCVFLNLAALASKLLDPEKMTTLSVGKGQREYSPGKRTILLYLVPWVLFSLINETLARNISADVARSVSLSTLISLSLLQGAGASLGAMTGGIIADFFGRRVSLSLGLTLYGLSSALIGLANRHEVLYFVYTLNGLNWGILLTLYLLVVWGDLSTRPNAAGTYCLGLMPFYLSSSIGYVVADQISQIPLTLTSLLSCLLIFLSDIPLILAPELLPSDLREKTRLKLYLHLVRRKKQNHAQN